MKAKSSSLDYQRLFLITVKKKYLDIALGLIVSYLIVLLIVKYFPKNISFHITLPSFAKRVNKKIISANKKVLPEKSYIIQDGDDLWHIAEKFYGSGFNAYDISVVNKITDPSILEAGQKITIPAVTPRQPTVGDISAASTSQVTYVEGSYVVQPGDSLSIIAGKVYGDIFAWPRLLQANHLYNPNQIEVGMVLTIPR